MSGIAVVSVVGTFLFGWDGGYRLVGVEYGVGRANAADNAFDQVLVIGCEECWGDGFRTLVFL